MDMKSMLDGLDNLLEDRATGDDIRNLYEVVIADTRVLHGTLYITVQANDGKVRHFRLTEV